MGCLLPVISSSVSINSIGSDGAAVGISKGTDGTLTGSEVGDGGVVGIEAEELAVEEVSTVFLGGEGTDVLQPTKLAISNIVQRKYRRLVA